MQYTENTVICNCKSVTLAQIDDALHQHERLADVEEEFKSVQELTGCSTGCGGCYDKIIGVISKIISG